MKDQFRYTYVSAIRTRELAERTLEDCFATGEVTPGEFPLIETYTAKDGRRFFKITLAG